MSIPNLHSEALFTTAYAGRSASFYSHMLGDLIKRSPPGLIVDLGAGLGLFAELAHQWKLDVIAMEGSSYAVSKAQERVPGLRIITHDLGDPLPLSDNSTSAILLNQVIEHIDMDRYKAMLRECMRVLKPNGKIFIYSPSSRNLIERLEPTHINMMLPSELEYSLRSAGFSIIATPNHGLWFTSSNTRLLRTIEYYLLKLFPHDWVSATANAIAEKPS